MSDQPAGRWHDLKTRMVSAVVMVAVGAVEIWVGGPAFAGLVVLLTCGMIWELARISAPTRRYSAWLLAGLGAVSLLVPLVSTAALAGTVILAPALAFALTRRRDRRLTSAWAAAVMLAGYGLITLREAAGTEAVLWLILVVVTSDVMGYFVGRTLGGPKFWPAMSPKKTWSGTVAGWLGAAAVGFGFVLAEHTTPLLVLVSVLVAFAGQMGDIAESWLKRRAGIKDASNLIPGHGGLLDRFDALTGAAVGVLALGLVLNIPLPQPMPFAGP